MAGLIELTVEIAETDDALKEIQAAIKEAMRLEVVVGIPDEANGRPENSSVAVTNAELLFIHTNGSPINNIPARPVIEPALEHDKEKVSTLLEKIADAALSGDKQKVVDAAEKAGQQGANIVKAWFTNPANDWAPNSDSTINGWSETDDKTGKKRIIFKGKGSSRPLIDTGEMRKSITYKVRRK